MSVSARVFQSIQTVNHVLHKCRGSTDVYISVSGAAFLQEFVVYTWPSIRVHDDLPNDLTVGQRQSEDCIRRLANDGTGIHEFLEDRFAQLYVRFECLSFRILRLSNFSKFFSS